MYREKPELDANNVSREGTRLTEPSNFDELHKIVASATYEFLEPELVHELSVSNVMHELEHQEGDSEGNSGTHPLCKHQNILEKIRISGELAMFSDSVEN